MSEPTEAEIEGVAREFVTTLVSLPGKEWPDHCFSREWQDWRLEAQTMIALRAEDKARIAALEAQLAQVRRDVVISAENITSISTPMMGGDNLAVTICSHFDDGESPTDDENGWSEAAINAFEEIKQAMTEHMRAALDAAMNADSAGGKS